MPLKTMVDEQPTLNLTPMLDVVFLLIIFFMVGTQVSELREEEQRLDISVPQVGAASAMTAPPIRRTIHIDRDGQIEIDQQVVSLEELHQILKTARAEYPKIGVVIRGDGRSDLQTVVSVHSACTQAGVTDIGLAVRETSLQR